MQASKAMKIGRNDVDTHEKRSAYVICVVGCGRMGLPHACLFAEAGFNVIGVDVNPNILNTVKTGRSPFIEPGLEVLIRKHVKNGSLTVTNDTKWAASKSDVIMFVVPTTVDNKNRPNYSYVVKACREVGMGLREGSLIIFASTVGPGVTETLIRETLEEASGLKAGKNFGLAFSPIRATSGRVLRDIAGYLRVVGAIDQASLKAASAVLGTIVEAGIVEVSSTRAAEAVKLFQNVYRDVNIALANEFARFCEKAGIDYFEVQEAANTDPYCHLLKPGIVGGHIPKDPYLLVEEAKNLSLRLQMTTLARKVNEETVNHTVQLVREALRKCGKPLRRSRIAVLGVSYRPNVKEPRGSRAARVVKTLAAKGATVKVYDPFFTAKEMAELGYPAERNLTETVRGTDCVVITVGHNRFRRMNLKRLKTLMREKPAIVDAGHVLDLSKARKVGFVCRGLGRGP